MFRRSLGSASIFAIIWTSLASAVYFSLGVVVPGDLEIHGHVRRVEATGRIGLPGPGLLSPENRVGIELSATVDRRDFGLHWQERLPDGGDTLGWDVTLEALLEFVEG